MKLDEARWIVRDSILHIGFGTDFDEDKIDRAIKAAGYRFLRETGASITTTDISISSGDETVNLVTTITDFEEHWFLSARIGYDIVEKTTVSQVVTSFEDSVATGQPTHIAFESANSALLHPQPDAGYTLSVTHRQDLIAWTPGVSSNPTLNIPSEFAYDVLWWGARSYLLMGLKGHGDAEPSAVMFDKIIAEAKGKYQGNSGNSADANAVPRRKS